MLKKFNEGYHLTDEISFFERQTLSLVQLEKELYQLYSRLSKKVDDLAAKTLFSYLANDSLKHSRILGIMIDEVNISKIREQDCNQTMLYTKQVLRSHTNDLKKRGNISLDELEPLIDAFLGIENLLFTEYKKAFHMQYSNLTRQEKNDAEINIFSLIVDDEDRHQKILSTILALNDIKLSCKENSPVVKYQNPDSWYTAPR